MSCLEIRIRAVLSSSSSIIGHASNGSQLAGLRCTATMKTSKLAVNVPCASTLACACSHVCPHVGTILVSSIAEHDRCPASNKPT
jgi:hypothetical protein